jgi:hypothetical protein
VGLGQREAFLAALDFEPLGEQAGVLLAPFMRRLGVHLAVQGAQLAEAGRGLLAVNLAEGDVSGVHHKSPTRAGAALRT